MQWQYQVRTSELPYGMAIPFAKETLRVMQDAIPVYKALSSRYAEHSSSAHLPPPSCRAYVGEFLNLVTLPPRPIRLGGLATVVYADCVERAFLDWRWWLGQLE